MNYTATYILNSSYHREMFGFEDTITHIFEANNNGEAMDEAIKYKSMIKGNYRKMLPWFADVEKLEKSERSLEMQLIALRNDTRRRNVI